MAALFDTPLVCPVLIGRTAHRDALVQAVAAAAAGKGGTVLLAGEAGIGKSRLVAEVRALASQRRCPVFEGRTFETDRALPFAPLLDLLRGCLAALPQDAVEQAAGTDASDLVRLLPELAARLPALSPAAVLEPEGEKRRLFHALAGFLLRLAPDQPGPLLLIVEDVHWADETSLEFLAFLARRVARRSALLLITYRSDELHAALSHFLTALDRERLAAELALGPLTLPEVEAMLRAITGRDRPVRAAALHALHGLTEGNPFFIEEVLRSLAREGADRDDLLDRVAAGGLPVPRTVHDAVQRRLAGLGDAARETLVLAAVAGQRWDFALIQELTGLGEAELLRQVKELVAAGLVVEESADRLAFRHALTREAVCAELLARERRLLHGRVAEALERRAGDAEGALGDLAYHFFAAGDWGKAIVYGRQAGERAQAMHAPRAAVEQFGRALDAGGRLGVMPDPSLRRLRGQSYETLGDFDRARDDYETALAQARAAGDRREEWEALHALGFLWAGRDYARTGEYFRAALELARRIDDPALLARSLNRMGNWHLNVEEPEPAMRHHGEALAIVRAIDDPRGVAETLDLLGMAAMLGCDPDRGTAFYEEAITRFRALDDRRGVVAGLLGQIMRSLLYQTYTLAFVPGSTVERVANLCEEARALAGAIGWRAGEAWASICVAETLAAGGAYGRALESVRSGLAIAEEIEHRQWMTFAHAQLGRILLDLLALSEARAELERAHALAREIGSLHWLRTAAGWLASTLIAEGDLDRARFVLDAALGDAPPVTLAARVAWSARLELALACGDLESALRIADIMVGTAPNAAGRTLFALAVARAEALACLGRPEEAEGELRSARALAREQGAAALLWRVDAALGRLYREQGRRDEAQRAFSDAHVGIAAIAASIPDERLSTAFLQEAGRRLPAAPAPSPRDAAKQGYGGLTAREREVAVLVGRGLSNKAIADTLVLGERTVETHVSNILAKLSFTSRAQIAGWAVSQGLSRPE